MAQNQGFNDGFFLECALTVQLFFTPASSLLLMLASKRSNPLPYSEMQLFKSSKGMPCSKAQDWTRSRDGIRLYDMIRQVLKPREIFGLLGNRLLAHSESILPKHSVWPCIQSFEFPVSFVFEWPGLKVSDELVE